MSDLNKILLGVSGKIIHSYGSNANGQWIRFASGKQICWGSVTVAGGSGTPKSSPWVFPMPFASYASIFPVANSTVPHVLQGGATYSGGDYKTNTNIYVNRTTSTNTIVSVFAIGNWK